MTRIRSIARRNIFSSMSRKSCWNRGYQKIRRRKRLSSSKKSKNLIKNFKIKELLNSNKEFSKRASRV